MKVPNGFGNLLEPGSKYNVIPFSSFGFAMGIMPNKAVSEGKVKLEKKTYVIFEVSRHYFWMDLPQIYFCLFDLPTDLLDLPQIGLIGLNLTCLQKCLDALQFFVLCRCEGFARAP